MANKNLFSFIAFLLLVIGILTLEGCKKRTGKPTPPKPFVVEEAPQDLKIPKDLKIILSSSGRKRGSDSQSLTIFADGKALYKGDYGDRTPPKGSSPKEEKKFQFSPESLKKIYWAVEKKKFFELKKKYADPAITDGDRASLTITAKGKTHRVTTTNIAVEAFDHIVRTINKLIPIKAGIFYNALHVKSYTRVSR